MNYLFFGSAYTKCQAQTAHPNIIQVIGLYNIWIWYNILRDFKKFTSKKIIESIKEEPENRREWILELFSKACKHLKREQEFKVWQDGYHAEELYNNNFIYQKLDYIHQNPIKEMIVEKVEDYMFSSARNYSGQDAVLEIELIPHELKTY